MAFLIIGFLIFFIGMIFDDHRYGFKTEIVCSAVGAFVMAVLLTFVGSGIATICGDHQVAYTENYELVSLKDNTGANINTYLLSTSIKDSLNYICLINIPEEGITTKKIDIEDHNVYIRYTDETPTIVARHYGYVNPVLRVLFFDFARYDFVINIPEGSVIENVYEVDLE
jgi:uncharacterized membrane protein YeaQ/YmgE (transglycosylase-associated protein family)